MDKQLLKLFELYKVVLMAHITTKTICPTFHPRSAEFYEILFDVFHELGEKYQDTGIDDPANEETAIQDTYDSLVEAKDILTKLVGGDVGTDNLVRGLIDKLEGHIGNCRAFLEEEKEEK